MLPLAENIKRYFSLKEITIVLIAIVISVAVGAGVFFGLSREVVINDNGKPVVVKTMKFTVKEVLEQNGIKVGKDDYLSVPLNTRLQKKNNVIYIKRAVPVNVLVDGKQIKLMTYKENIKEALEDSTIKIGPNDRIEGAKLEDKIVKDMTIKIVRVKEEIVKQTESIAYNVITRNNNSLDKGVEKVISEGKEGVKEKHYKVVYEDGKEASKQLVKETIISNPVDKIVEVGTLLAYQTSRGDSFRYTKVLDMYSTAYTSSYSDTGKSPGDPYFGITSSGMRAQQGVIAVDPSVIPLGTRVYVEVAGSTPDYGYVIAADTGGAIKGNLIDLYFEDAATARSWGYKKVKVYILEQ